jgi:hypothetical protein
LPALQNAAADAGSVGHQWRFETGSHKNTPVVVMTTASRQTMRSFNGTLRRERALCAAPEPTSV